MTERIKTQRLIVVKCQECGRNFDSEKGCCPECGQVICVNCATLKADIVLLKAEVERLTEIKKAAEPVAAEAQIRFGWDRKRAVHLPIPTYLLQDLIAALEKKP